MGKRVIPIILLIVVFLIGLGLLLYPFISNYYNTRYQSYAMASYEEKAAELSEKDYSEIINAAQAYNDEIAVNGARFILKEEETAKYRAIMDIAGNGVIGTLTIDAIDLRLPIYLGTGAAILQVGVGHIEGTSLPIGGVGTHSALSGHRGLPSAKLFTEVDLLEKGDVFLLKILNREMFYEIDQIKIVLPEELSDLDIDPNEDYCTLVTCTPYGINSHRLLLRGTRIYPEIIEEAPVIRVNIRADSVKIPELAAYGIMAVPAILFVMLYVLIKNAIITSVRRK